MQESFKGQPNWNERIEILNRDTVDMSGNDFSRCYPVRWEYEMPLIPDLDDMGEQFRRTHNGNEHRWRFNSLTSFGRLVDNVQWFFGVLVYLVYIFVGFFFCNWIKIIEFNARTECAFAELIFFLLIFFLTANCVP